MKERYFSDQRESSRWRGFLLTTERVAEQPVLTTDH